MKQLGIGRYGCGKDQIKLPIIQEEVSNGCNITLGLKSNVVEQNIQSAVNFIKEIRIGNFEGKTKDLSVDSIQQSVGDASEPIKSNSIASSSMNLFCNLTPAKKTHLSFKNSRDYKASVIVDHEQFLHLEAVFDLDLDSLADPDGFSAFFFYHYRDIILSDIVSVVCDFFNVNGIHKKLLNSRIASILPDIISPAQSGFTQGRIISDNIFLAQEMTHDIGYCRKYGNVLFKLDMSKAYD
ncbi:hypothetical protein BUALT_Bualt09G0020300 [Buddleja alternifolia]|uniref:Reverse transcriptase domain-containing protein n=1 Tax=Buddleja alternifolia TaxID=168488 RepID=A0AAV6XA45_9LAMI|nr:hypothetical protein BUALT_Bualt09G0020300 [Buddleja alternifolia]